MEMARCLRSNPPALLKLVPIEKNMLALADGIKRACVNITEPFGPEFLA